MNQWVQRAQVARQGLVQRFWGRRSHLFHVAPGAPGVVRAGLRLGPWHYWWQAHAMSVLLDGHEAGDPGHDAVVAQLLSGVAARAHGLTTPGATDDRAWLGLELARGHDLGLLPADPALALCESVLADADQELGGVRWARGDDYLNVPATGPAVLLALRVAAWDGDLALTAWALEATEWLHEHVVVDGLVRDGVRWRGPAPGRAGLVVEGPVWSYNVGLVAACDVAVASIPGQLEPERAARYARAASTLVRGCSELAPGSQPWRFEGVGDPTLFRGILARYLAEYLLATPRDTSWEPLRATLLAQADAVWAARADSGLFPPNWGSSAGSLPAAPALRPTLASQVCAAMVLGAAARVAS